MNNSKMDRSAQPRQIKKALAGTSALKLSLGKVNILDWSSGTRKNFTRLGKKPLCNFLFVSFQIKLKIGSFPIEFQWRRIIYVVDERANIRSLSPFDGDNHYRAKANELDNSKASKHSHVLSGNDLNRIPQVRPAIPIH